MERVATNQAPFDALMLRQTLRRAGRRTEVRDVDTTGMGTVELTLVSVGHVDVWATPEQG